MGEVVTIKTDAVRVAVIQASPVFLDTDASLAKAMRLIADHGAIKVTLEQAKRFVQEAKDALLVFPDSPIRRALAGVADYTVHRLR